MRVPILETERLLIRPFTLDDLDAVHALLDVDLADAETGGEGRDAREERRRWLEWTVLSYEQLAQLHQPPYGDRAIVLRPTGQLIGACGFAPVLDAFGQLPGFREAGAPAVMGLTSPEVGLYWAVARAHQGQGYATEAARALITHGFESLRLRRLIATTTYANAPSSRVMEKLGMRIERNPYPEPPWLQVVGVLERDAWCMVRGT